MKFVLYNAAHEHTRIQSCDKDAWIRILGFFNTRESAIKHANKLSEFEPQEIRIAPVAEFRLIMKQATARAAEEEKHRRLLETHANNRVKAFADTRKNADNRIMGDLKFSPRDRIEAHSVQSHKVVTGGLKKIPSDYEQRMQKFAAIAVVPDYEHESVLEHRVKIWEKLNASSESKLRNEVLHKNLNGRTLPSTKEILEEWVGKNLPPQGYNVYGQLSDDLWSKNSSPVSDDPAVQFWVNSFMKEYDTLLWKWLDAEKPKYTYTPFSDIHGAEPAVAFLHTSNTEEEMDKWIKESSLTTYDIACVTMYEWIKVDDIRVVEKKYREPMLDMIHNNVRAQAIEASKLIDSKVIEIEG
jgi:hypothetical protein